VALGLDTGILAHFSESECERSEQVIRLLLDEAREARASWPKMNESSH